MNWNFSGLANADYAWHHVTLGTHIEHAYHILSLNEKRWSYEATLWECKQVPLALQIFEQCWLAGDHSNIGGSWHDQQLADIALAWIMSRFDALGLKLDPNYLYNEYLKFNDYVKVKGPPEGYPASMSPRQWGEGTIALVKSRWPTLLSADSFLAEVKRCGRIETLGGEANCNGHRVSIQGFRIPTRQCIQSSAIAISARIILSSVLWTKLHSSQALWIVGLGPRPRKTAGLGLANRPLAPSL